MSGTAAFVRSCSGTIGRRLAKPAAVIVLLLSAMTGSREASAQAAESQPQLNRRPDGHQCLRSSAVERIRSETREHLPQVFAPMDDEHRDLLKRAQSAWISFREASRELEASQALHGSMHGMMLFACRTAMTRARKRELIEWRRS
jgi:uncharacterized protein YecT (DUF1311 family)